MKDEDVKKKLEKTVLDLHTEGVEPTTVLMNAKAYAGMRKHSREILSIEKQAALLLHGRMADIEIDGHTLYIFIHKEVDEGTFEFYDLPVTAKTDSGDLQANHVPVARFQKGVLKVF